MSSRSDSSWQVALKSPTPSASAIPMMVARMMTPRITPRIMSPFIVRTFLRMKPHHVQDNEAEPFEHVHRLVNTFLHLGVDHNNLRSSCCKPCRCIGGLPPYTFPVLHGAFGGVVFGTSLVPQKKWIATS